MISPGPLTIGQPHLTIALTDLLFGANPAQPDLTLAASADTLAEVIATIFANPPADLTTAQELVYQTLLDVLSTAGVEAEAVAAALAQVLERREN